MSEALLVKLAILYALAFAAWYVYGVHPFYGFAESLPGRVAEFMVECFMGAIFGIGCLIVTVIIILGVTFLFGFWSMTL